MTYKMDKSMWQQGYDDGFRRNECFYPNNNAYMSGYRKGIEDKDFCDAYSDEAFGIYD